MRIEKHNLDGTGPEDHEVYDMPPGPFIKMWPDDRPHETEREYWPAVTDVLHTFEWVNHGR